MSGARGPRLWTALLIGLALLFPVGALLQPWLWPARSQLPAVPRQLNQPVILITVAGLRADRLHHLGYARATSPSIDRLADSGVSFQTFYASSNDALSTAAALLTGLCPLQTGLGSAPPGPAGPGRSDARVLPAEQETLAERALAARYSTAAVLSNPALIGHGLEQGFSQVAALPGATAEQALSAAAALLPSLGDRFLLWIDLGDLCAPYGGDSLDLARFAPDAPPGFGSQPGDYDLDEASLAARGFGARERAWLSARYDAALFALDAAVGRFVETLSAQNRLHTLTLCLTGLRGERLDERAGRAFTHGVDLYEPSLRVPFVLTLPAKFVRGLRLDRLGHSVDVAPTLADLGLRQAWPGTSGISLAVAIRYQQHPNKFIFAQGALQPRRDEPALAGQVLRLPTHKLITNATFTRNELYLIASDPGETTPVAVNALQLDVLAGHGRAWFDACVR
ncbi:MAG: sulfatase-like hydrolase/transferase [Planctomycetota bacterium]